MKIAILGMGGIGGLVGACLAKKFDDIYFIARGENLNAINKNGLTLKSDKLGEFNVKPALTTDNVNDIGVVDAIIIATKSYSLESACRQCEPIINSDTIILPLLNGVSVSEDIVKIIGNKCQIADGCIHAFANIASPGVITHLGEPCHIKMGFMDGRVNQKAQILSQMLNEAGIKTVYSTDILVPIWEKYIVMCGNSCIFSYFECSAGEIRKSPEKLKFVNDVYTELYNLAKANGVNVADDIVEKYNGIFSKLHYDAITSLYRDIRAGKTNTEFNSIIGKAYKMAVKTGIECPCITKTYNKYKVL